MLRLTIVLNGLKPSHTYIKMHNTMKNKITIRDLGEHCNYQTIWQRMVDFTLNRTAETNDEIWLLQHNPVFTLGKAASKEHILDATNIPVVQTDRGGQVTYHGPGQLLVYALLDLQRLNIGVKKLVDTLLLSNIQLLADYGITATTHENAPGVYVGEKKIASLGLRVRKRCCYHGIAFNVDMDLSPFLKINPCGFRGLQMTQLRDFVTKIDWQKLKHDFCYHLANNFGLEIKL